jgi:hypothetical protein
MAYSKKKNFTSKKDHLKILGYKNQLEKQLTL